MQHLAPTCRSAASCRKKLSDLRVFSMCTVQCSVYNGHSREKWQQHHHVIENCDKQINHVSDRCDKWNPGHQTIQLNRSAIWITTKVNVTPRNYQLSPVWIKMLLGMQPENWKNYVTKYHRTICGSHGEVNIFGTQSHFPPFWKNFVFQ